MLRCNCSESGTGCYLPRRCLVPCYGSLELLEWRLYWRRADIEHAGRSVDGEERVAAWPANGELVFFERSSRGRGEHVGVVNWQ